MSGLDLKSTMFYLPEEVGAIFRRDTGWAYKAGRGFLKSAARRFGRKQTLFLRSEVDRIAAEGLPITRRTRRNNVDAKAEKRYDGELPENPGGKAPAAGGATDA